MQKAGSQQTAVPIKQDSVVKETFPSSPPQLFSPNRSPAEVRKLYRGISAPPYSQLFVYSELLSCPPILSGPFTAVACAHLQHLLLKDLRPQSWEPPIPIPELLANLVTAIYGFHEVRTHLWQSILAWPQFLCLHNTCNPITERSFPKFP